MSMHPCLWTTCNFMDTPHPCIKPVVEKTRIKGKFDGGLTYHTLGDRNAET